MEEHNRLVPQELCPTPWRIGRGYIVRQGYVIKIKAGSCFLLGELAEKKQANKQKIRSVVFPLKAQVGFCLPHFPVLGLQTQC